MYEKLRKALDDAKAAREAYLVSCRAVWLQVEAIDPELTAMINRWGLGEDRSMMWLCEPNLGSSRKIPAELVVAGHGAELKEVLERAGPGYIG